MPLALPSDLKARLAEDLAGRLPDLVRFYQDLHAHPELSGQEERTAAKVAAELSALGLQVTTGLAGHGVVGVLANGPGPTILLRADLDALPIEEATGLPYMSRVRAVTLEGVESPVMHACGHDLHATNLVATVDLLARHREAWSGTLVAVGQPAEETINGARRLIGEGLYQRFPRPDLALAIHVKPDLAAGQVALRPGPFMAAADSLDIVVRGRSGHGATPHKAKDPIVLAAQIILALQTLVSRQVDPLDMAVITVGAIQGGTQRNIIPDRVTLKLTVRSYQPEVRDILLSVLEKITRGLGLAAGLEEADLPQVTQSAATTPAVVNDPAVTADLGEVLADLLGRDNVVEAQPLTGSEDFAEFGQGEPPVPLCLYLLGCAPAERVAQAERGGPPLPLLHTPAFAPLPEPSLRTGALSLAAAALALFRAGQRRG
jgi:hippurate hydrolase